MKVIVQNLAIEYEDEGQGKTLLFLHGWQSNLHTFDDLAFSLKDYYRILRLDLPGFGGTEMPKNEAWDLNKYVLFVRDFVLKLNLEVHAIVGHSFGGRIVIKGRADNIFNMEKLILIGSGGMARRKTLRNYILKIIAKIGGFATYTPPLYFWRAKLRKRMYDFIGSHDYLDAGELKNIFVKIIEEDLTENAKNIKTPTLLIWGANDNQTPLEDGQRLARLIENSKIEALQDCGHFVHEQKPKEVLSLIQNFLQ